MNASELDNLPEPSVQIPHNNQTGRYVSVFKAQWSRNPSVVPHFTCGNMKRHIDVFAYDGTQVAKLESDVLTAVPAGSSNTLLQCCSWSF